MKQLIRFHHAMFAGLVLLASACGDSEPTTETLAANLCTCIERDEEEPWSDEAERECRTQMTTLLTSASAACRECLGDEIGDETTAAACAAANACDELCGS